MHHEPVSVFDIFKIGVGPSSSHTLGPWRAALSVLSTIKNKTSLSGVKKIQVLLYGSLAKTGKGHGTDIALQMGLMGEDPVSTEVDKIPGRMRQIETEKKLLLNQSFPIAFDPAVDIVYLYEETLPYHPNALSFLVELVNGDHFSETYYSIGGGFVEKDGEKHKEENNCEYPFPYPIHTPAQLLQWCTDLDLPIHAVVLANEQALLQQHEIMERLDIIWSEMKACIFRGCHTAGELPGGLGVRRRAFEINRRLLGAASYNGYTGWAHAIKNENQNFTAIIDWISCFALAVNEENASFGRVVTAPTNGAAGVIPAVLHYYTVFCKGEEDNGVARFLLTAGEIGSLFKKGATISAAMGGCQAEIGVSSAMAAGALTECLGGTPEQAMMAAEIAMEHHLGMTCDPIGGLVQVPCIERNTMGAIKAITAAQLALQGEPAHAKVSLDKVIQTMWETALDMNVKYKETADGGLAITVGLRDC